MNLNCPLAGFVPRQHILNLQTRFPLSIDVGFFLIFTIKIDFSLFVGLRDDGKKSPQSVKSVQSQGSPLSPTSESSSNQFGYFTGRVSSQIDGCKVIHFLSELGTENAM